MPIVREKKNKNHLFTRKEYSFNQINNLLTPRLHLKFKDVIRRIFT